MVVLVVMLMLVPTSGDADCATSEVDDRGC